MTGASLIQVWRLIAQKPRMYIRGSADGVARGLYQAFAAEPRHFGVAAMAAARMTAFSH